jgi:hypothetical protein
LRSRQNIRDQVPRWTGVSVDSQSTWMKNTMDKYPHQEPIQYAMTEARSPQQRGMVIPVYVPVVPLPSRTTSFKFGVIFGVGATVTAFLAFFAITHF